MVDIATILMATLGIIAMPFGFLCGWQVCKYHMMEKQELAEIEAEKQRQMKPQKPERKILSPEELVKQYDQLVSAT